MGFQDRFAERAPEYAAYRPSYPAELVDWLADAAPDGRLVWEAGCGSGQLSVPLARRFRGVLATDASGAQLASARLDPGVWYVRAAAEAAPIPAGVADLCVAAQAAHWFDLERYYAEVARVGRPGALLALVTYAFPSAGGGVDEPLRRYHDETLAGWWPTDRHEVGSYGGLPFPFAAVEAPPFEIRAELTLPGLLGYVWTWSGTQALVKGEGRAAFDALGRELGAGWGPAEDAREVIWPLRVRAGRV